MAEFEDDTLLPWDLALDLLIELGPPPSDYHQKQAPATQRLRDRLREVVLRKLDE